MRNIFKKTESSSEGEGFNLKSLPKNVIIIIAVIILIIAAIATGITYLNVSKKANEQSKLITSSSETIEKKVDDSNMDLKALLEYLDGLDSAVLDNADALNGLGDYSDATKRKMSSLKNSTQSMIDLINNYLVSGEDISPEVKARLEDMLNSLTSFKNTLDSKDEIINKLLEEYKNADDSRREEIISKISGIFKEISMESESVSKSYSDLIALIESLPESVTPELNKMINLLKVQMDRFTTKLIPSLDDVINPNAYNMSASLERGFSDLNEVLDLLHEAIDNNKSDVTNLLNKMQEADIKDRAEVTSEFNTVTENIETLRSEFISANEKVTDLLKELDKTAEDNQKELKTVLTKLQTDLNKLLEDNFKEIDESLVKLSDDMDNNFKTMTKSMNDSFSLMDNSLTTNFKSMNSSLNSSTENITNTINATDAGLKEYLDNIHADLNQKLDKVFQYVSDGKRLLASALLTKGVTCAEDASFKEIYEAILKIKQTLVIGVDQLPGEITYDYHYHTDGSDQIIHAYEVGVSQIGGCFTNPIYHVHTGSPSGGGGCYTVSHTGTRTVSCGGGGNCWQGPYGPDTSGQEYYVGNCSKCGSDLSKYGSSGYVSCGNSRSESYTYYTLGCGMTPQTIIGYRTACGLSDGQVIGAHIIYEKGYSTGFNGNLNNASTLSVEASPLMAPSLQMLEIDEGEEVIIMPEEIKEEEIVIPDSKKEDEAIIEENTEVSENEEEEILEETPVSEEETSEENGEEIEEIESD